MSLQSLVRLIMCMLFAFCKAETSHAQEHTGAIKLHLNFLFHGQPLETGKTYQTASGDMVRLQQIRFYIGYLYGITADGSRPQIDSGQKYRLVDTRDSASMLITIPVKKDDSLNGIGFRLGVDSLTQLSGAGTGALDPLNGMYWTWNSGYVAVKMEGQSPASAEPGHQIEYHLGGYLGSNAVSITMELKSEKPFRASKNADVALHLAIELDCFFTNDFSIAGFPALMTPGPVAKKLMQKFKNCFLNLAPITAGQ